VSRQLATTAVEIANMLSIAVPRDNRDTPVEKPTRHRRTHQADTQQPDADLLLTGLAAHLLVRDHFTHASE
jgi:hypothetical protein